MNTRQGRNSETFSWNAACDLSSCSVCQSKDRHTEVVNTGNSTIWTTHKSRCARLCLSGSSGNAEIIKWMDQILLIPALQQIESTSTRSRGGTLPGLLRAFRDRVFYAYAASASHLSRASKGFPGLETGSQVSLAILCLNIYTTASFVLFLIHRHRSRFLFQTLHSLPYRRSSVPSPVLN